jgi:RNA polymerase sigma factor (TIGR02999 family)
MSVDINQLEPNQITVLLDKASTGDDAAFNQLIPIIYPELKLIASGLRRKNCYGSKTLNTTALVNEVWLKLHKYGVKAKSRKHFYCICAKSMRQIMLNSAQEKLATKRKGEQYTLTENISDPSNQSDDVMWMVQLDAILASLEKSNPRLAEVFQLKYFLGFSEDETAKILEVNDRTVRRDWVMVKKLIKEIMD